MLNSYPTFIIMKLRQVMVKTATTSDQTWWADLPRAEGKSWLRTSPPIKFTVKTISFVGSRGVFGTTGRPSIEDMVVVWWTSSMWVMKGRQESY